MACSFKYCQKRGKCFLQGVSPCSDHGDGEDILSNSVEADAKLTRRMGLSRNGFVRSRIPTDVGVIAAE